MARAALTVPRGQHVVRVGGWDEWATRIAGRIDDLRVYGANGTQTARWPQSDPEEPWAVHLADRDGYAHVLVVDVDCKDGNELDARRQADRVASLLELAGLKYVTARSGPSGGVHLYVPLKRGWPMASLHTLARGLHDVCADRVDASPHSNAKTGAIRAPGAPHPSGTGSCAITGSLERARAIFDHANEESALRELARMLGVQLRGELPASWWTNLTTGTTDLTRAPAKNEARRSLLRVAFQHGCSEEWLRQMVKKHQSPHAGRLLEKRGTSDYLHQEWVRLQNDPTKQRMGESDRVIWASLAASLAPDDWVERWRERETLRVLLARCWRIQTLSVDLSVRDLAESVGASRSHVSRLLARLEQRGYLSRTTAEKRKNADRLTLTRPTGEGGDTTRTAAPQPSVVGLMRGVPSLTTPIETDTPAYTPELFWSRVGGIGPRGQLALALLAEQPDSAAGLANRMGLRDERSLRRTHLARLSASGLIACTADGTYYAIAASESRLRRIAFEEGALGNAQRRRQRIAEERIAYGTNRRDRYIRDLGKRAVQVCDSDKSIAELQLLFGVHSRAVMEDAINEFVLEGELILRGNMVRRSAKAGQGQISLDVNEPPSVDDVAASVAAVLEQTPRTVRELAGQLGIRTGVITEALDQLKASGTVLRGSDRAWHLAPLPLDFHDVPARGLAQIPGQSVGRIPHL